MEKNYYGSLCTEMYEILHKEAPQDELQFYLSYGQKGKRILEALCGSGRFLIPFSRLGFDISGMDASKEMVEKLKEKVPDAQVTVSDIENYSPNEKFDYIFISSGSVSLFTDITVCKSILQKMKELLNEDGIFVFAVDTTATKCPDDIEYKASISVKTEHGYDLILKNKNYYEESTQTQFSPSIYELYDGETLLQDEPMDFQIHLYKYGEMEQYLKEIGFSDIKVYSDFNKTPCKDGNAEMFLFECKI